MAESGDRWWATDPGMPEPTARWLGLFRRAVSLNLAAPSILSIPSVRINRPQSVAGETLLPRPTVLTAQPTWLAAQTIYADEKTQSGAEGGSVGLSGVFAEDTAALAEPIQEAPEHGLRPGPSLGQADPAPVEDRISLAKRLAYLLQPPTDLLISARGPLEWNGTLFPYQLEGIQALLARDVLLLADDMGLGKTIQAIAALRILAFQHKLEAALVVLPTSLLTQWRREIRTWAPELRISTVHGLAAERAYQWSAPAHIYLTTYGTLRSDFTTNPASPPRRRTWDVVILDEAQQIKNRDTDVSQKCKLLPRKRAWALTGTPLENQLDDLASILEFLCPLAEGESPVRVSPGSTMLERHKTVQLRRKKADVLPQLPPKTISHIVLPLAGAQRETYERAKEQGILQLRNLGEEIRIENILELVLRLKQVCNFCPTTGQSAKLEDIRERLSTLTAEGHRALIFSQFTDGQFGVDAIAAGLAEFRPLRYTGALSSPQRQATIESFRTDVSRKALILSLRAGGQGLNLQEASYVFHLDRWWNPAVERQAEDRSHRLGQSLPVHVYKYTCEGTIEERIDQILRDKQLLFDAIVDDVSIDLTSRLTADELYSLFDLTPPTRPGTPARDSQALPDFATMNGTAFEEYVKKLLEHRGWTVRTTPISRDGGIDLVAERVADLGSEITLFIQCKNYAAPAGVTVIRELNSVLPKHPGCRGVIVCPGGFTADSRAFAQDRGIALWDRQHLFTLSAT